MNDYKIPWDPKTKPTSLRKNLLRSAEEFLACRKSSDAARECPAIAGGRAVKPLKSDELLEATPPLQFVEIPIRDSNEEFRECPANNKIF